MSESLRVLGQAAPVAATDVNLYIVPAGRATVLSAIFVANRGAAAGTFRVAVRPGGAALAALHYTHFDVSVAANTTTPAFGGGITLAAGDIITVRASTADFSFSVFGSEVVV